MCKVFKVSRSGCYKWKNRVPIKKEDMSKLDVQIR